MVRYCVVWVGLQGGAVWGVVWGVVGCGVV